MRKYFKFMGKTFYFFRPTAWTYLWGCERLLLRVLGKVCEQWFSFTIRNRKDFWSLKEFGFFLLAGFYLFWFFWLGDDWMWWTVGDFSFRQLFDRRFVFWWFFRYKWRVEWVIVWLVFYLPLEIETLVIEDVLGWVGFWWEYDSIELIIFIGYSWFSGMHGMDDGYIEWKVPNLDLWCWAMAWGGSFLM